MQSPMTDSAYKDKNQTIPNNRFCIITSTEIYAGISPTAWGTDPPNVGFHSPRSGGKLEVMLVVDVFG